MNPFLLLKLAVYSVLGAIVVGCAFYVLFLQHRVKDLEQFKATVIAESALRIQENTLKEKDNASIQLQAKDKKNSADVAVAANFKRLRDADRPHRAAVSSVPAAATGMPSGTSYDELAEWYTNLVIECTRAIEAATLTTNQVECLREFAQKTR